MLVQYSKEGCEAGENDFEIYGSIMVGNKRIEGIMTD
jgi:hypothetical protein